jgi:hypothetical protein
MSAPEDPAWLAGVVDRSPALPDDALRAHWKRVLPWLPVELRYELAGILMDLELTCQRRA